MNRKNGPIIAIIVIELIACTVLGVGFSFLVTHIEPLSVSSAPVGIAASPTEPATGALPSPAAAP